MTSAQTGEALDQTDEASDPTDEALGAGASAPGDPRFDEIRAKNARETAVPGKSVLAVVPDGRWLACMALFSCHCLCGGGDLTRNGTAARFS